MRCRSFLYIHSGETESYVTRKDRVNYLRWQMERRIKLTKGSPYRTSPEFAMPYGGMKSKAMALMVLNDC